MTLTTLLVILLVLILIGALPVYPYSREWGYYPSGSLAVIVANTTGVAVDTCSDWGSGWPSYLKLFSFAVNSFAPSRRALSVDVIESLAVTIAVDTFRPALRSLHW